jgi:hydrogenase expression/formation protein HypE
MLEKNEKILLSHGSGGILMHKLIDNVFKKKFSNEILDRMSDSAVIELPEGNFELCFTTDSYVVDPIFFPEGNIGKLAVCGTVNDLAVEGAKPLYLSCGVIVEEGFLLKDLEKITETMASVAKEEGIRIVTGDFKVVEKNKADKIFINTSGIGVRKKGMKLGPEFIQPGDKIIINGHIGEHGVAVLAARGNFNFDIDMKSDCAPLYPLIKEMLKASDQIRFMRDPTRGGLATTLNEIVSKDTGLMINEENIPVREEIRAACEILGFDPLFLANEGKVIAVCGAEDTEKILDTMRNHPLGKDSCIIGEVIEKYAGKVIMKTGIGGHRVIEMLTGEQLPRIC